jgi:hypothetical protein
VLNSCRSPSLSALGQRVPVPASRLPHLRPPRASKGTGAETTKQKIISARSARPAPPRPARPRSQKGIVGLPPEPSGAEARVALQLRPEHSGPRTSPPGLWAAVGTAPGRGACLRVCFREVWLAGSRNRAGEAGGCRGFASDRQPGLWFHRSRGPGVRPLFLAIRQSRAGRKRLRRRPLLCVCFAPALRLICVRFSALRAKLLTLGAFGEVKFLSRGNQPVP